MLSQKGFILRMQEHIKRKQFPFFATEDLWGRRVEYDLEQQEVRFLYEDDFEPSYDPSPYNLGKQLSQLHQASAGFSIQANHPLYRIGTWSDQWFKRIKRIQAIRDQLYQMGIHSQFEELFLEDYTYFNQLAQVALFYLEDHHYVEIVRQVEPYSSLAYRSFSWKDVEQSEYGFSFIHPENWIVDIAARDLGQFTRSSSMETLSFDETIQLLQGYQHERELLPTEYQMIYAQLLYPNRWVGLVERYTARHKYPQLNWEEEIRHLHVSYQEWEPVLAEFADRIYAEFGARITPIEWIYRKKALL